MENINRVTITGNLTRDPELRHTTSGTPVCTLGVAVNGRRKDSSGNWVDKPNYFNVIVWGKQGENANQYLSKGRPVAIDGRLDWRSWEAKDGSGKRSTVEIVADTVQYLGGGGDGGRKPKPGQTEEAPAIGSAGFEQSRDDPPDDDIPF